MQTRLLFYENLSFFCKLYHKNELINEQLYLVIFSVSAPIHCFTILCDTDILWSRTRKHVIFMENLTKVHTAKALLSFIKLMEHY